MRIDNAGGHPAAQVWLSYVRDELDELDREQMEQHMLHCEVCLESFMAAVEEHEPDIGLDLHVPDMGQMGTKLAAHIHAEDQHYTKSGQLANAAMVLHGAGAADAELDAAAAVSRGAANADAVRTAGAHKISAVVDPTPAAEASRITGADDAKPTTSTEPLVVPMPVRRAWFQHPAIHYGAAAVITLFLLTSGTFNSFSDQVSAMENAKAPTPTVVMPSNTKDDEKTETWSDKMVDRTITWFDEIESVRFK
ncbi:zf-HC2 domain-containing protein [Paenibacillus sp. GCM10023252]|uniref:zf-HC2 domain-containing protein n=1 Tax=Paenibacillus sp. GCM10023252 TaxID=3252649 RepID=UPI003605FB05